MSEGRVEQLATFIRDVPDFPKEGIVFKDITPLLADATAFSMSMELLGESLKDVECDLIMGPEARGFIFGCPLALHLDRGFAPIRKKGKLPWKTIEESYALEYGEDTVQMHADAVKPGQKVVLVDDLLATGGTMAACRRLVEKAGGVVVAMAFVIELSFLNGREKLGEDARIVRLLHFD